MARVRFSAQTGAVLLALAGSGEQWRHGYELAREVGLKSGTLYPILIRLAERGFVAACWEDEQPAGRPRRHLYRLTAAGAEQARQVAAAARDAREHRAVARRLGEA
jgi:PadR family transcriptional regulator, regulatory protein PadR